MPGTGAPGESVRQEPVRQEKEGFMIPRVMDDLGLFLCHATAFYGFELILFPARGGLISLCISWVRQAGIRLHPIP